jgi:hypothetical protein
MKIPLHGILAELGLNDLVLDNPEDVAKFKVELQKVIDELEAKGE